MIYILRHVSENLNGPIPPTPDESLYILLRNERQLTQLYETFVLDGLGAKRPL